MTDEELKELKQKIFDEELRREHISILKSLLEKYNNALFELKNNKIQYVKLKFEFNYNVSTFELPIRKELAIESLLKMIDSISEELNECDLK